MGRIAGLWVLETGVNEWAGRYGPAIGMFHLGLFLMAVDFGAEVLGGRTQAAAEWYDGAQSANAPALRAKIAFVGIAFWAVFKPS